MGPLHASTPRLKMDWKTMSSTAERGSKRLKLFHSIRQLRPRLETKLVMRSGWSVQRASRCVAIGRVVFPSNAPTVEQVTCCSGQPWSRSSLEILGYSPSRFGSPKQLPTKQFFSLYIYIYTNTIQYIVNNCCTTSSCIVLHSPFYPHRTSKISSSLVIMRANSCTESQSFVRKLFVSLPDRTSGTFDAKPLLILFCQVGSNRDSHGKRV